MDNLGTAVYLIVDNVDNLVYKIGVFQKYFRKFKDFLLTRQEAVLSYAQDKNISKLSEVSSKSGGCINRVAFEK